MDIIRKANILDQDDLLLLENHNLDITYNIVGLNLKKIPRLFLLVNLLDKYTEINSIIKNYLKYYSTEVNTIRYNLNALDICVMKYKDSPCLETIKILLEYGTNINQLDEYDCTSLEYALSNFNYDVIKLMLEYDGVCVKNYYGEYLKTKNKVKFNRLTNDINLLNTAQ